MQKSPLWKLKPSPKSDKSRNRPPLKTTGLVEYEQSRTESVRLEWRQSCHSIW